MHVAFFSGKRDNRPRAREVAWDDLATDLQEHEERADKDGPLWSPVLYPEGAKRAKEAVAAVEALVLDIDDGTHPDNLTSLWNSWEYVVYSTFSHTTDKPKWRAVFPLVAPVPAAEWDATYEKLATYLGDGHADPSCKDASRMFYTPSCQPGAPRFSLAHVGERLDPAAFPDLERVRSLKFTRPAPLASERVSSTLLLDRALERIGGGRHNAGLWLACQLRDNGFGEVEAVAVLGDFARRVPQTNTKGEHEPYTERQAQAEVRSAYSKPARGAWERFTPVLINGKPVLRTNLRPQAARDKVLPILKTLREDPESLYTEDMQEAIAFLRRYDKGGWARVRNALANARISLRAFEAGLPEVRTEDDHGRLPTEAKTAGAMVEGCPAPDLIIPDPYELKCGRTIKKVVDREGNPVELPVAFAPIVITGRLNDAVTGNESLLIAWKWERAGWRSRVVDRSVALVGRSLVSLAGIGFPISDDNSKLLVAYLARLEAMNRPALPCAAVTSHLGWQGDPEKAAFLCGHTLILPDGSVEETGALDVSNPDTWTEERVCFHGVGEGEEQLVNAFRAAGEFEKWRAAIATCAEYQKVMVAFYAAFAAPLLPIFNCPNFIIDFSNRTTTGKTTALRVAGSVWGNPDERASTSVVGTWDATRVWTERASQVLSCLPLIMDDTKKVKNKRMVADLIYAVTSGRGRGRGTITGLASTAYWRTILFSTGESPATGMTQDGGTRTRTLEITGMPFDTADLKIGKLVSRLNSDLCTHYGHAGPKFIQWLIQNREHWLTFQEQYQEWVEHYSEEPPSPEAGRLAQYVALITVASKFAHVALDLPWEWVNPFEALWPDMARAAADAAGDIRSLEDVMSWAHAHEHTFSGRFARDHFGDKRLPSVVAGRWDPEDEWEFIAFHPTVLRQALTEQGYDPTAILTSWRDRNWIECDPGKFTTRVWDNDTGRTPRMVKILRLGTDEAGKVED